MEKTDINNAVEVYLQKYNGKILDIASKKIEINKIFPNEYTGSLYTKSLKGGLAKAKANASQGIIEMAKIAVLKRKMENKKEKHKKDAKYGWSYYLTRFAIPVLDEKTNEISYNFYKATMVVQHAKDGKLYLYDIQEIKKETSTPLST